jgi:carbon storage regulator
MLVLSRNRDESIMIGDNIKITIVDIRGDKCRIGIEADSSIPVHRQEVYDAIKAEHGKVRPGTEMTESTRVKIPK